MTITQKALHITCPDGGHDLVTIESPSYLGPVEYAWGARNDNDPTVLGIGPLAGASVPGASGLVVAGRSLLWDGFHASCLPGAGLTLAAMDGVSLIGLRGRAPRPSVLAIDATGERIAVRLHPLDPTPLWQGSRRPADGSRRPATDSRGADSLSALAGAGPKAHDDGGVVALVHHIAHSYDAPLDHLQVLGVGPAAAQTRFGGICSVRWEDGQMLPVKGWLRRGGLGSRLFQVHHLCGVLMVASESSAARRSEQQDGGLLFGFRPGMTTDELGERVRFRFNPRVLAWGDLGATLWALRQRLLWFNGTSIHLPSKVRDDLYHSALRDHFLRQMLDPLSAPETHLTCGEDCPLACKTVVEGRQRDAETCVAFGPQLGVLDPAAVDSLSRHCETLGLDSLTTGAALAWLMERMDRNMLEPASVGLGSHRPRWSAAGFDPGADSEINSRLARYLVDGLLSAEWGEPLRSGIRHGVRAAGEEEAALASYIANGDSGEMAILPHWAPGFYTPMPISGEYLQYYGVEFVPPRVLGRKSAQRMVAELMLQNFGFCRLHRGWAEELAADLINRQLRTNTDWHTRHRDLAKRVFRRRKARFWETSRVTDIIATYLQDYQHDAAPDAELDRWVRRFAEDRASAARAYWSEVNAGMEEILGS
jgi:aldehyde:ferredoxin oxidoreductase